MMMMMMVMVVMVMMMMVMMIDHDDDDDAGYHVDYADDQEGGCSSNHLKKYIES